MAKTVGANTAGSEFLYNANRSRTVQLSTWLVLLVHELVGLADGLTHAG